MTRAPFAELQPANEHLPLNALCSDRLEQLIRRFALSELSLAIEALAPRLSHHRSVEHIKIETQTQSNISTHLRGFLLQFFHFGFRNFLDHNQIRRAH